ncbi:hypothetical protein DITRI_Ditri15bG0032400 [Diplodiscus trichospermus]
MEKTSSFVPSEQPQQAEQAATAPITYMNKDLFTAAANGDMKPFNKYPDLEKGLELTNRIKQMLRMKDKDGNTALHKAIESYRSDVVGLLVKELDTDDFSAKNKRARPDDTTNLEASIPGTGDERTAGELTEAKNHLIRETDDKGRTPIHYAAHFGELSMVKLMLEANASAACITDKERGMTALHMAAWQGHKDIMEHIISCCPGCCEIVDKSGWNFLHFAAVTLDAKKFDALIMIAPRKNGQFLSRDLFFEEDIDGITPLSVRSLFRLNTRTLRGLSVFSSLKREGYEESISYWSVRRRKMKNKNDVLQKQLREKLQEISDYAEVAGLGVHKSFYEGLGLEYNRQDMKEIVNKMRESHLLVATLVATVTFAAGIVVPGGYKSESTGSATLSHNSAFKAFIITDAVAFVSSLFAIFLHILSVFFNMSEFLVKWILLADSSGGWLNYFRNGSAGGRFQQRHLRSVRIFHGRCLRHLFHWSHLLSHFRCTFNFPLLL